MSNRYRRVARIVLDHDAVKNSKGVVTAYRKRTIVENLRVQFRISKTGSEDPNTATFTVTNLSEGYRKLFEIKPARLTLEAGYSSSGVTEGYVGDIRDTRSRWESAEWLTAIECGTGQNAANSQSSISFPPKTALKGAIAKMLADMDMQFPAEYRNNSDLSEQASEGFTVHGPTMKEISRLVKVKGYRASIQDGRFRIFKEDGFLKATARRIATDTGLVGEPELSAPEEDGKPPILHAKLLLDMAIQVGSPLVLDTDTLRGRYKAIRVDHTGDTHGQDWYTMIEARPL